jgi:uncharacterized oxidoreductase
MNAARHTVLITGGATGIGFAIAKKFHAAGNRVILVGRSQEALSKALAALPGAQTQLADVALAADRAKLVANFPDVTVLVNNAGVQFNDTIAASTPASIEYELNVNFTAPVLLAQAFLPLLAQQKSAAIINISSGLALVPKQSASIYCAAKAAMHSFSKTLRWQLEGSNIRVFEVLPPLVDTAMTAGRGKGKISADTLANEFWAGFIADQFEIRIGKAKLLAVINRIAPSIAEKIMRNGL